MVETAGWIFIIMELVEGGDLQTYIQQHGMFSEAESAEVMLRLTSTLNFLHAQGKPT